MLHTAADLKQHSQDAFNELDLFQDKHVIRGEEDETKRVELTALEFDWIFAGKSATNFIKRLANTDNDDLFAIPSIKILILFLWKKFFYKILFKIFIPFMIYFCFLLIYITHIYE